MASRVMSSDPCDSNVSPTATSSKYLVIVLPPVWSVVSGGEHAGRDPEMRSITSGVMAGWRLGARAGPAHGGAGAAVRAPPAVTTVYFRPAVVTCSHGALLG